MKTYYSKVIFLRSIPIGELYAKPSIVAKQGVTIERLTEAGRDDVRILRGGVVVSEVPWTSCACGIPLAVAEKPAKKPKDEAA